MAEKRLCSIDGCEGKHFGRGLCSKHYQRMRAHGDPTKTVKRPGGTGGITSYGYLMIGKKEGKRFAHILIAEKALGKPIKRPALVHHINGDRLDNRNENLVICPNDAYHFLLHQRTKALDETGNANSRKCNYCGQWDDPKNLYISHHSCRHVACYAEYQRKRTQTTKETA